MKKIKVVITFFLLAYFILIYSRTASAEGVQLSTTQIGANAVYTSQIPANPCVTFHLGEGKTRTVVGFSYSAFSVDSNGVMNGNLHVVDLSNSQVTHLIIAGNTITDFTLDPSYSQISNASEMKQQQMMYKLNNPITFTTADTASIVVNNVHIATEGKVKFVFSLTEPSGAYCLESGYTILTMGTTVQAVPSTIKATVKPQVVSPTHTPIITMAPTVMVKTVPPVKVPEKHTSLLETLFSYIQKLFSR